MLGVHKICAFNDSTDDWDNQLPFSDDVDDVLTNVETVKVEEDRYEVRWNLVLRGRIALDSSTKDDFEEFARAWEYRNDSDHDCCILCGKEIFHTDR